jgi:hypothetical protein
MAVTVAALDAVASSLYPVISGPNVVPPGAVVNASLSPDPTALVVTDFLQGPVDGVFITKDVVFRDPHLEPALTPAALALKILQGARSRVSSACRRVPRLD